MFYIIGQITQLRVSRLETRDSAKWNLYFYHQEAFIVNCTVANISFVTI